DRFEMLKHSLLRRLIVIGRDDQKTVGSGPLRKPRQFDGLLGVVRPRPGNDRNSRVGLADTSGNDPLVLLMRQGWAFARRPDRDEPMCAAHDLPIDKGAVAALVETPVLKWRDKRG